MVAVSSEFYTEGGWGVYLLSRNPDLCWEKNCLLLGNLGEGLSVQKVSRRYVVLKISLHVCVRGSQVSAATLFANSTTDVFVYLVMSSQLVFQLQGQCALLCLCVYVYMC